MTKQITQSGGNVLESFDHIKKQKLFSSNYICTTYTFIDIFHFAEKRLPWRVFLHIIIYTLNVTKFCFDHTLLVTYLIIKMDEENV